MVKYDTTYGHGSTGYKGRLFAKETSLQMAPRRIREIAYDGIGVRDWDVSSAYFTFALQAVEKLRIQIQHPHFQLATVRRYIDDRHGAWKSLTLQSKKTTQTKKANISSRAYSADPLYRRI